MEQSTDAHRYVENGRNWVLYILLPLIADLLVAREGLTDALQEHAHSLDALLGTLDKIESTLLKA